MSTNQFNFYYDTLNKIILIYFLTLNYNSCYTNSTNFINSIQYIMFPFTVTLTVKKIEIAEEFPTKKEAQKYVKELMKKHNIRWHHYFLVNSPKFMEIHTNY